jgi:EAL domain-containing protein (putative c-di-GMP-specific phosphodiesterase class I)
VLAQGIDLVQGFLLSPPMTAEELRGLWEEVA